ncbi:AMP-binding enzyme [compost metagenome]
MSQFAESEHAPETLPEWLQWQARRQGAAIALRHKRLGVWQVRSWTQVADEVLALASALHARGFVAGASLAIVSRPRPQALLAALAAQWLGGVAVLFDPLDAADGQLELLRELDADFVFAEGLEEIERLRSGGLAPALLFYADARGLAGLPSSECVLDYRRLAEQAPDRSLAPRACAERAAFAFYRLGPGGRVEAQRISHVELLLEARRLVEVEQLAAREEALAARAFAASGQARYLLAPWLIAGFRLNFPENLATRDNDRRELGPTLVLGTRETYGRLHAQVLERLPLPGSLRRRLVDWALAPVSGGLRRQLGHWLIRRPLRDVLGFGRTRVPLLVGAPLEPAGQRFFASLGIEVRNWPVAEQWHSPSPLPRPASESWRGGKVQPV